MTLGKILDIHRSWLVARGGRVVNESNKEPHDVKTPLNDVVCYRNLGYIDIKRDLLKPLNFFIIGAVGVVSSMVQYIQG